MRNSTGRRILTSLAVAGALAASLAGPATAADPETGAADVIVDGTLVRTGLLPRGDRRPAPDPRSAWSLAVPLRARVAARPASGAGAEAAGPGLAEAAAPDSMGFSAFSGGMVAGNESYPVEGTGAVLGSTVLVGSDTQVSVHSASMMDWVRQWQVPSFFALPGDQYYWSAFVASSRFQNRFVAVLPSFDDTCGKGWLNVAVSTTSNPSGSWRRFRIPMADAWTDGVSIGVSDNKVVIAVNEWDLDAEADTCLGSAFEGSRIRVMDWSDLLDGGTLTVKDVSSTPRTSYYSWVAASNVPGTASTEAGNTISLVGDKYAGGWGHVAYATVTGSARAGTAKLAGLTDLTVSRSLTPLAGPPSTIAAFPSGNGFQDERVVSAVAQGSRLWFSSNATCVDDLGPGVVACARFTRLDLGSSPPLVADDGYLAAAAADTFHPLVGMTRGGSAFLAMTRAASVAPAVIETYVTYRDPGTLIAAGAAEELIFTDPHPYGSTFWPASGSLVPDPGQGDTAWAVLPTPCSDGTVACAALYRFRSRLSAAPGGSATLGDYGNGWVSNTLPRANFSPLPTSPIKWVRVATSPTTEDTTAGFRLVDGTTWPSVGFEYPDLSATATEGGIHGDTVEAWIQWGTGSAWSEPVAVSATIDLTEAEVTRYPVGFAEGKVGETAPVRISWSATDPESGIATYHVNWNCDRPDDRMEWLPPTSTSHATPIHVGTRCTQFYAMPYNGAGFFGGSPEQDPFTLRAAQDRSSALSYAGSWSTATSSKAHEGSTRYSTRKGASVTYSFTGRALAFVTTLGPNRGRAEIWVDGVLAATVDLKAETTKYRRIAWSTSWPKAGQHTVQIKVLGTSGRPRVDVDVLLRL